MNLVVDIEYTLMKLTNSHHRKARPMIDHIVVIFIIKSELQKNIILVDKLFELVKNGSTCIVKNPGPEGLGKKTFKIKTR
jgi:hypothetical protein